MTKDNQDLLAELEAQESDIRRRKNDLHELIRLEGELSATATTRRKALISTDRDWTGKNKVVVVEQAE